MDPYCKVLSQKKKIYIILTGDTTFLFIYLFILLVPSVESKIVEMHDTTLSS